MTLHLSAEDLFRYSFLSTSAQLLALAVMYRAAVWDSAQVLILAAIQFAAAVTLSP